MVTKNHGTRCVPMDFFEMKSIFFLFPPFPALMRMEWTLGNTPSQPLSFCFTISREKIERHGALVGIFFRVKQLVADFT